MGDDWTIVHITDTHTPAPTYSQAQFTTITNWIAANTEALNIQMVLHTGDVVEDGGEATHWTAATAALAGLAGQPHLITTGNHDDDTGQANADTRSMTNFNTAFPQSRYTAQDWWSGGFFEEGHTENAYYLATISGKEYLFMTLEFGPRQAVVEWAAGIMATYSTREVIVATHSLVFSNDTLVGTGDRWNPHAYNYSDDVHDGDELWTELIKTHNVILGLSGHILNDGDGKLTSTNDAGRKCHMMLANYQYPILAPAESGYVRLITVKPSAGTIEVRTYSPLLDANNTDADHQFDLVYPVVPA